jgi:hypothetical protein
VDGCVGCSSMCFASRRWSPVQRPIIYTCSFGVVPQRPPSVKGLWRPIFARLPSGPSCSSSAPAEDLALAIDQLGAGHQPEPPRCEPQRGEDWQLVNHPREMLWKTTSPPPAR